KVKAIPLAVEVVVPDDAAICIPENDVAPVAGLVSLDDDVVAIPDLDAITAHRDVHLLAQDDIVADDAAMGDLQIDTKKCVLDPVVDDRRLSAIDHNRGILAIVIGTGVTQRETGD